MTTDYIDPEEIDSRLGWPLGTARRLARRGKLPHYLLPDESLRFVWAEVEAMIRRRGLPGGADMPAPGATLSPRPMM
jgi:hypothetical protein